MLSLIHIYFEATDGFVVAGRHVHLPVGDGERVGFMVGGNHESNALAVAKMCIRDRPYAIMNTKFS